METPISAVDGRHVPDPTRRREDARRRILSATVALLTEAGYQRLTIEGIAARASVGKQTIYRWWPTKGAVVLDAFLEHRMEGADSADAVLAHTGDFATELRRMMRETVIEFSTPSFEAPYRALVVAIQDDPELARQVSERIMRAGADAVRGWLAEAIRAKGLREDIDLDLVADLMFGPIMRRWLLRSAPLDEAFADELTEAVLRVLRHPGRA